MIKVRVKKASNFPVSSPKIKRSLKAFLRGHGIVSDTEVSVALVGKEKMIKLARKYLNERQSVHNVLSFTENEVSEKFVYPPEDPIQLGEIVVCYPKAQEEANEENKLIDEKVIELVEHGALHLLGIHHK